MNESLKTTESRRRANAKYDKSHYKVLTCKYKLENYDKLQQYAHNNNIKSISALLSRTVQYCMDNDIDLSDENP